MSTCTFVPLYVTHTLVSAINIFVTYWTMKLVDISLVLRCKWKFGFALWAVLSPVCTSTFNGFVFFGWWFRCFGIWLWATATHLDPSAATQPQTCTTRYTAGTTLKIFTGKLKIQWRGGNDKLSLPIPRLRPVSMILSSQTMSTSSHEISCVCEWDSLQSQAQCVRLGMSGYRTSFWRCLQSIN
jgi:hypothetical protein